MRGRFQNITIGRIGVRGRGSVHELPGAVLINASTSAGVRHRLEPSGAPMRRLLVVELAAVATISVIAGLGFHRVFVGQSFLWPVAGAAGLAVIISTLTALRRTLAITTLVLVHILGFVVYVTVAALGSTSKSALPSLDTLRTLVGGLTGGWADLLSISLPAAATPRLLVTACAVSWMGAALASEMAHRSRNAVAPVIPPVVAYSITLMLASGERVLPRATTHLLWGRPPADARPREPLDCNRARRCHRAGGGRSGTGPGSPTEVEPSIDISADRYRILAGLPVIAIGIAAALAAAAIPAPRSRFQLRPAHPPLPGRGESRAGCPRWPACTAS